MLKEFNNTHYTHSNELWCTSYIILQFSLAISDVKNEILKEERKNKLKKLKTFDK